MAGRLIFASMLAAFGFSPVAAQSSTTRQSPTSPQPTVPRSMPDLDVPVYNPVTPKRAQARHPSHQRRHSRHATPADRPALANVELLEPLPHPPEPPHVVVPTPAYPFENFVTTFTTPPPPIVCHPTRHDPFKPKLGLIDERPVLCTADNP